MSEEDPRPVVVPMIERDAYEPSWYRVLAGMRVGPSDVPDGEPPATDAAGGDEEFVDLAALEDWVWAVSSGRRGPDR